MHQIRKMKIYSWKENYFLSRETQVQIHFRYIGKMICLNAQETYCICWELEGEKLNQKLMIIFILHQINLQWNQWHKQLLLIIVLGRDQMADKNYFPPWTIVKSSLSHYTITQACLTGVEQLLETFAHQTSLNDFLP